MAATGKTPISLYVSTTASNVPTAGNLVDGELAINSADGLLFYKDNNGVVQKIANKNAATLPLAEAYGGNGTTVGGMYGFANRIINGDMRIDQRNSGGSVTPTTNGQYTLDRWAVGLSLASKYSIQQNGGGASPFVGFSNYVRITSLSAYTVVAGDYFIFSQPIEGFNFADMMWGTANAQPITLTFRVQSSLTGTFGGSIVNSAYNRSYPFTFSIPVANTPTTISLNINGDTSGTWIGATNGIGVSVEFSLGMGSTRQGTANTWNAGNYHSVSGAVNLVSTNGATLDITGVDLRKGTYTTAPAWDFRDYGRELMLCQRYGYFASSVGLGLNYNTTDGYNALVPFPVQMRSTPSVVNTVMGNGTFNTLIMPTPNSAIIAFTGGTVVARQQFSGFFTAEL